MFIQQIKLLCILLALVTITACDITHKRAGFNADRKANINLTIDPVSGAKILTTTSRPVDSSDGERSGYILSSGWNESAPDEIILKPMIARFSIDDNHLDKILNLRFVIHDKPYNLRTLEDNKRSQGKYYEGSGSFIILTQSSVKIPISLFKLATADPNCQFVVTVTDVTYTSNCSEQFNMTRDTYGWHQAQKLLSRVAAIQSSN